MEIKDIEALKMAVEMKFEKSVKGHADFVALSEALPTKISVSTLKRIWGYNKGYTNVSDASATILAQYLEYVNYEDFVSACSLKTEEHEQLHTASKIAMLSNRVHSDRSQYVYNLFNKCEYHHAFQILSTIDKEVDRLIETAKPHIEYVESITSELCLKAQLEWSCHYNKEGTIEKINKIFERAIPLAKSINDHFSLWYIYEHWAYWVFLNEEFERALELNTLATKQAKILLLEVEDEQESTELAFSLSDRAYFLIELGQWEEAIKVIEEAMECDCDPIIQCYLLLNYAKAHIELQEQQQSEQKVDYEKIYKEIIERVESIHSECTTTNESVHLLFLAHFNLGVFYEELQEHSDHALASEHLRQAVKIYDSRNIPDPRHKYYYEQCEERLARISS